MKTWSKYIIFIITIFAIFLCKGETLSSKNNHINLIEQIEDKTENLTTDFHDSYIPQYSSFLNNKRIQKNHFRRYNSQKYFSCSSKSDKTANHDICFCTANKSSHKIVYSSKSSYRLIRLGRLVI